METIFSGIALDATIVSAHEGLVLEIEDRLRVRLGEASIMGVLYEHQRRLERQASRTAQDLEELRSGITLARRIDELIDLLNDFDTPRKQYEWLVLFDDDYLRLASEIDRLTDNDPFVTSKTRPLTDAARYAGRIAFERLELRFPRYAEKLSGQLSSHAFI